MPGADNESNRSYTCACIRHLSGGGTKSPRGLRSQNDFSHYQTYRWAGPPSGDDLNQLMQGRVVGFIEEALSARRLKRVQTGGDLVISANVSVHREDVFTTFTNSTALDSAGTPAGVARYPPLPSNPYSGAPLPSTSSTRAGTSSSSRVYRPRHSVQDLLATPRGWRSPSMGSLRSILRDNSTGPRMRSCIT